ncbi:MAG: rhodanese-like domain-containing protein [Candidatus Sumerlaeota bacterium]
MGFLSKMFGGKDDAPKAPTPNAQKPAPAKSPAPSWQDAGGVPQELAATEVLAMYQAPDRPAFLDVREPEELEASGMIPGAVHIPMHEIQGRTDELDPATPVIVYCASGMRSMDVGAFLLQQGFTSVSNLNGGLNAWKGPIEKKK